jgi:DNA-directed RNA polymerase specialized sigma24 family protein
MAGRAWTLDEEAQLLEELSAGVKLDEILVSHRRTQGAIRSRQRKMAANFYLNGMKINEISLKCRLSVKAVEDLLKRRNIDYHDKPLEPLEY